MRTVIICDEQKKNAKPDLENAVVIPFPGFLESEQRNTTTALQTARRMQADCVIIYRNKN